MAGLQTFGQSSQSPYSALGLGDIIQPYLVSNQSLGGLAIAYPNSRHFNLMNPALQGVKESLTTFEAGYSGESRMISQNDLSQRNGSGNLMYLGISFPMIRNSWSSGLALVPYSYSNYNIVTTGQVEGKEDEEVIYNIKGQGGISSVFWSHGVRVTKNLSLGAKISYMFGSYENETIIELDQDFAYNSALSESVRIRDFSFGTGIVYRIKTGDISSLYLGGIYEFKTNLKTTVFETLERLQSGSNQVISSDTVVDNLRTQIVLPMKYGFGLTYVKGLKWLIGADFVAQHWEDYESLGNENYSLTNSYRGNLGFEFIPDINSVSSYMKRMIYRTGIYYEMTPYMVDNDQVYDFGINFGVSLPVGQASLVNLSLQYGQRDGSLDNSISESYFRFSLGLTVNDVWFYRRKID